MTRVFLRAAAWLSLAFILYATLSPIDMRPRDVMPVNIDRALAFCVMAGLFTLAYPRRWRAILVMSVAAAGLIETLQLLSPTRHAHLADALVKAAGAVAGVSMAAVANAVLRRRPLAATPAEDPVTLLWLDDEDDNSVESVITERSQRGESD